MPFLSRVYLCKILLLCLHGVCVQVLCVAAVNPATFLSDHGRAITVAKHVTPPPEGVAVEKGRPPINVGVEGEGSMSLVWIITGVPNLTKVHTITYRRFP